MRQTSRSRTFFSLFLALLLFPGTAMSTPTQFGETGYLSVPSADIVRRGSFSWGAWINYTWDQGRTYSILPISVVMGIGDAWELYASYPNLLFNDDNDGSRRGYDNIGFKYRLSGDSASNLKMALSTFLRQTVSHQPELAGLRDIGSKLIFTYKYKKSEASMNFGYLLTESPSLENFNDEWLFAGSYKYTFSDRFESFIEIDGNTDRTGGAPRVEITPGIQYYFLPYLSLTAGFGTGLTDKGPEYRATAGVVYTADTAKYIKAIPVIPGSREKYAFKEVSAEELMPDIPSMVGVSEKIIEPPARLGEDDPGAIPQDTAVDSNASPEIMEVFEEQPPLPEGQAVLLDMKPIVEIPKLPEPLPEPVVVKSEEKPAVPVDINPIIEKTEVKEPPDTSFDGGLPSDILFDFDKHDLTDKGKQILDIIADKIEAISERIFIYIEGHTDNWGSDEYNLKLSQKRAESVMNYLIHAHGMDPYLFFAAGYGESKPVATNDNPEGREKNRRTNGTIKIMSTKETRPLF